MSSLTSTKSFKNILVLPMCGLGDAVCYLPSLRALRQNFPAAHIVVIVVSEVARLILETEHSGAEIIVFNRGAQQKPWRALLALVSRIRSTHFDVVISGAHPNSTRVPMFAMLSGARIRIGASMERLSFLYNRKVDVRTDAHAHERFRRLLSGVGLEIPASEFVPQILPPPEFKDKAESTWRVARLEADDRVIGIASGADSNDRGIWKPYLKRWKTENYADLVRSLARQTGLQVVMFGGKEEIHLAQEIARQSGVDVVNLCGKTDVLELPWLLKRCVVLITNDTGIMHLSAAVGVPTVALFGPTSASAFGPVGDQNRIVQGEFPCAPCYPHPTCELIECGAMNDILVSQVEHQVISILAPSSVAAQTLVNITCRRSPEEPNHPAA